jgi:hypothetical protein
VDREGIEDGDQVSWAKSQNGFSREDATRAPLVQGKEVRVDELQRMAMAVERDGDRIGRKSGLEARRLGLAVGWVGVYLGR